MIPQRVKLKGFLCYKDEQSIEFDGNATLWMLCGLNGSGKSAIFDAVTYALFGHHRGGGTHAYELINKDSDTLLVEFDFLLDNRLYRAKRTLRRDTKGGARGTQQIFRSEGGNWIPLEGTGQKREFDAWIDDNLGLSYDTFTSSVLLLQGKAEKLLDSKPEGRREVLAGIVDLSRYERLHQKADEKRKSMEGALKALSGRLAALPTVAPLELEEARARIVQAEDARAAARAEVERLVSIDAQIRAWQELQNRLQITRTRWQKARSLLSEAARIEQDAARLRELREVLPRLREIVTERGLMNQADEQIRAFQAQRELKKETLAKSEANVRTAREHRSSLQIQKDHDQSERDRVQANLRATSAQLVSLREVERQENELLRLRDELSRLPSDPAADLKTARDAFDRLDSIDRVVPILHRFRTRRAELLDAAEQQKVGEQQLRDVRARGERLKQELEGLRSQLDEATRRLQSASEAATEARTLLTQARESLEELQQIDGARVCRHCGQNLTPAHLGEEKKRRTQAVKSAETRSSQTLAVLESARSSEAALRERIQSVERDYQAAREEYREANGLLVSARQSIERLQQECGQIWQELPLAQRARIAPSPVLDWGITTYPEDSALDELRAQTRGLDLARKKLQVAEQVLTRHGNLKAQEAQALENLNRVLRDLPRDREQLRREHADLEARDKALFKNIDALRKQIAESDRQVASLESERDTARKDLEQIETRIREQQLAHQTAERALNSQMRPLPPTWQPQAATIGFRELHTLTGELKHLEDKGTDEMARDLEHARHHVSLLEQEVKQLEQQDAAFPPEARENPATIAELQKKARESDRHCDETLRHAQQQLALLESYQKQREQIDAEYRALEKDLTVERLLAELLGKDRLQLYLVRQAERQVVEYANAVLDRLSGGQLYLRLSGEAGGEGASAKALDLEAYNRSTGERPINVAFLSGSQKFRVAVSLALGIGQYASRQHRPIESVIIDEGFGCLDNQGRQVMIQELQNLRSQMRCILLVSHQEDFAEAFSDGYQFRLEEGATRIERFQK